MTSVSCNITILPLFTYSVCDEKVKIHEMKNFYIKVIPSHMRWECKNIMLPTKDNWQTDRRLKHARSSTWGFRMRIVKNHLADECATHGVITTRRRFLYRNVFRWIRSKNRGNSGWFQSQSIIPSIHLLLLMIEGTLFRKFVVFDKHRIGGKIAATVQKIYTYPT